MTEQSYVERPAVPALAGFVSSVWVQQIAADAPAYRHREIPHGGVDLVCRLGAPPELVGTHTRGRLLSLPPGSTIVGIRFRPGAVAPALGVPASELTDLVIGADELWGRRALDVGERAAAGSPAQAGLLLQRLVGERLAGTRPGAALVDPAVAVAVRRLMPGGMADVSSLSAELGLSESTLRRRCQDRIGLGPKSLQRILRFQGFLARVQYAVAHGQPATGAGLASLALAAGYADQAHLSRECSRLTGTTPRAFLHEIAEVCTGGHDHETSYAPLLAAPAA